MSENDIAIAAIDRFIAEQSIDRSRSDWKTRLPRPPQADFDASKRYFWDVATNVGDIKIQLMPDVAPMHVSSTIYLARLGFYDGVIFHRVIKDFMIQTGDPIGDGTGGPGYTFQNEPVTRSYKRGIVAMANAGKNPITGQDTNGSQFFIVHGTGVNLPPQYTIFGQVTQGMETVDQIAATPVRPNALGEVSSPIEPPAIETIEIVESQ